MGRFDEMLVLSVQSLYSEFLHSLIHFFYKKYVYLKNEAEIRQELRST